MGPRDTAGIGSKDPSLRRVTIHQMVEDLANHVSQLCQHKDEDGGN